MTPCNRIFFRRHTVLVALAFALGLAVLPTSASALSFHIVNQSTEPDSQVYVDIVANGAFEVPGWTNDESKPLSEIPGGEVTIRKAGQRPHLHLLRRGGP